jgi:UDP:flavonoid glycosyltransferase YjiC (YdhE family)
MSNPPLMPRAASRRPRILFVAEAVTLAHVARPLALAQALDPNCFEVHVACDPRYQALLLPLMGSWHPLHSIPSPQFLQALAKGQPVYDAATLRAYVGDDLQLLQETRPDLVVGDFRLSLAVSAPVAGVPYWTISNAYWSPYARQRWPVPDLPLTRLLGVTLAGVLFRLLRPVGFALHTLPLNRVRKEYGLPSLGWGLRTIYTWADQTLYSDVPELVPTFDLPSHHHYLGPILWSPAVPRPDWWDQVPQDKPVVYATGGSSGGVKLLPLVLEALAGLPVSVLAATAGQALPTRLPGNTFVAEYLPGHEAAARARIVICNGGSPTTQQALAAGKPVLGIASNLDQYLNMQAVERTRAGCLLRAGTVSTEQIRSRVLHLLDQSGPSEAAARLAQTFARYPASERFKSLLHAHFLG